MPSPRIRRCGHGSEIKTRSLVGAALLTPTNLGLLTQRATAGIRAGIRAGILE
jgi:hypothetical protein